MCQLKIHLFLTLLLHYDTLMRELSKNMRHIYFDIGTEKNYEVKAMAIDKYEYKIKTEEMLDLMESGAYKRAAEIADTIDWRKVRNSAMLITVSEIYEMTGDFYKSYDVLTQAYTRETSSRNLLNRLCELAIKTGNVDEAIDFYDEFVDIAPKDPTQYILRYKILKARRAPLEQQIEALIKFKRFEYIEEWAYELARKYQEAGMTSECIEECDDLILWFNEGKYVYKAMELKMQYKPLTKSQQERYNHRYERRESITEEIPDVEQYTQSKAQNLSMKAKVEAIEKAEQIVRGSNEFVEELPYATQAETTSEMSKHIEDSVSDTKEEDYEEPSFEDEVDKSLQKLNEKGIVQQMNLGDALMSLLRPDEYQKTLEKKAEEERNAEKEATVAAVESQFENVNIPEYAHVLDAIESVIDVNLVNKMVDDANNTSNRFDSDLEELKPEPIEDETEEIPSVEEFITPEENESDDLEKYDEEVEDPVYDDDFSEYKGEDEFADFDEEEFTGFDEEFSDYEESNIDEFMDYEESEIEELIENEEKEVEELLEEKEVNPDIDENTVELQEEEVDMKETKKVTPILPPDIQRLIDEIEGVIPEEPEKEVVTEVEKVVEEPHENMGKVTEQLRMDDVFSDLDDEEYTDFEDDEEDEFADFEEEEEDEFSDFEEEEEDEFSDFEEEEEDEFSDFEEEEEDEFLDFEEEEEDEFSDFEEEEEDEFSDFEEEKEDEFSDFEEEKEGEFSDFEEEKEDEFSDLEEEDEFSGFEEEDSLLSLFEEDGEDLFDENFDYDDLRNSLEKEFSPVVSDDEDEREIPDDDDSDIPDILSATTPLSRKETAKLHATGKTAPIPVGELTDALSLSNTGFVVQGRYDLSAQSGIGTRAGLTEEQKQLFSYFVPVRGMSEQLVDVLEQDKNCTNRQGTSKTGNLLIIGNKGNGKTVLAVDVVKAIQKQRDISHGKVAIVTGESLNKKKISEIFSKLRGGAIIIEKAGKMNEKTITRLNKAMEQDTGELLVVLEEQRKPLDRLLSINRDFRRKFTSRLEVPILINDELVTFGQSYADENGYKIDEMGILALYSRIDSLQREDHFVTIAEVKEVMDEAIAHNQKGAAKKLVKKVFKKNTENNKVLLSENDFNI